MVGRWWRKSRVLPSDPWLAYCSLFVRTGGQCQGTPPPWSGDALKCVKRKLKARLLIPAARTLPQNIVHRPSGLPKEKLVESHCPETSLPGSRCIWPCASSALNFCPYFQFPCGSSCDQLGKVSSVEGIETLLPVVHTHSSEPRPVCSWLLKVKTA